MNAMGKMTLMAICMAAALLAGCTSYDFRITRPTELARVISNSPQRLETANMTYQMQAKENRLVVQVFNAGNETVQLLGDRSFVVDTRGASHPLRSQAIAPQSYAKLILPPLRPRFERQDPSFQFGVGTTISEERRPRALPVQYLDIYEDSDNFYWDWDGELPIRLSITYQFPDGRISTDEFGIEKTKRQ